MEKERIDSFIGARSLSIVDAMGKIDINSKGILFIVDENGSLVGSLTDGDIRRWLLKSGKITVTVVEAMNPSPCTLTSAKDALRIMKDKSITAIPIIDTNRNIVDISNYVKNSGKDKVVLTVERDNKEIDITINLSKVEIPYVTSKVLEKNDKKIGYIAISLFSGNSYKQFKNNLDKIEKENIDGLIIDVRGNSGGYLSSVTDISSLFLEKGKVIYQLEDSTGKTKKKDTTKEKRTYPVAVLIDSSSASASEILASAIKESYNNGLVVGTTSYGKGTVQETKKLLDGSMIKYTTNNRVKMALRAVV